MATRGCINSPDCFCHICSNYTVKKLKDGIFVGPGIKKLMRDPNFEDIMETKEKVTRTSFKLTVIGFLGNKTTGQ